MIETNPGELPDPLIKKPDMVEKFEEEINDSDISLDFEGKEEDIDMFIHGLAPKTSPQELESYLANRCEFMDLIYLRHETKKNLYQSVAFFTVKTREIAKQLVKKSGKLNGRVVHCDIKYCDPRKTESHAKKRLFLGGLPKKWTDEKIEKSVSKHAKIRAAYSIKDRKTGKGRGYGYVDFFKESEAKKLLEKGTILIDGISIDIRGYEKKKNKAANYQDFPVFPNLSNQQNGLLSMISGMSNQLGFNQMLIQQGNFFRNDINNNTAFDSNQNNHAYVNPWVGSYQNRPFPLNNRLGNDLSGPLQHRGFGGIGLGGGILAQNPLLRGNVTPMSMRMEGLFRKKRGNKTLDKIIEANFEMKKRKTKRDNYFLNFENRKYPFNVRKDPQSLLVKKNGLECLANSLMSFIKKRRGEEKKLKKRQKRRDGASQNQPQPPINRAGGDNGGKKKRKKNKARRKLN